MTTLNPRTMSLASAAVALLRPEEKVRFEESLHRYPPSMVSGNEMIVMTEALRQLDQTRLNHWYNVMIAPVQSMPLNIPAVRRDVLNLGIGADGRSALGSKLQNMPIPEEQRRLVVEQSPHLAREFMEEGLTADDLQFLAEAIAPILLPYVTKAVMRGFEAEKIKAAFVPAPNKPGAHDDPIHAAALAAGMKVINFGDALKKAADPGQSEPAQPTLDLFFEAKIQGFGVLMLTRLRGNTDKGVWQGLAPEQLLRGLRAELAELMVEMEKGDRDFANIQYEAADIANYAMMIADAVSRAPGAISFGPDEDPRMLQQAPATDLPEQAPGGSHG